MELSVERANDAFRNSGLGNISLQLVYTEAVHYDEHEEFIDLYRMVDGDGPFKNVRRLRDEKHADIVGLIVDNPKGCGLSTRVAPDAEEAYFVVQIRGRTCRSESLNDVRLSGMGGAKPVGLRVRAPTKYEALGSPSVQKMLRRNSRTRLRSGLDERSRSKRKIEVPSGICRPRHS